MAERPLSANSHVDMYALCVMLYKKSQLTQYTLPLADPKLVSQLRIVREWRNYVGADTRLNLFQETFFTYPQRGYTTRAALKSNIVQIQRVTGHRKLVYTSNINSYDTFSGHR